MCCLARCFLDDQMVMIQIVLSAEYQKEEELTDGMNRHAVIGVLNEFPFKKLCQARYMHGFQKLVEDFTQTYVLLKVQYIGTIC